MTIEEKAKAFDEALDRCKEWASGTWGHSVDDSPKDIAEFIFPQLTESEDERIRKALIEGISQIRCKGDITREQMLAYLEKQKDASKAIEAVDRIDKYIDEHLANAHDMKDSDPVKKYYRGWDDALGELAKILLDVYSGENQTEQKPAESISQLSVKGKGVYKICPYCKERMIRDDSKVYTSIPPQYGYNCPKCGAVEFDTVIYDNPEIEEQKQECGDDERIREDIIALIKFALNDGSAVSPGSYTTKEEAIAYLEKLEDKKPVTIEQVYEKFLSSDTLKLAKENKYIRAQLFWELMHNGIITEVDYMYLTDDKRKPWTEEEYLKAYRNGFDASEQLKNLGV